MTYLVELWIWSRRQVGERRASRLVSLLTGYDRSTVNYRVKKIRSRSIEKLLRRVKK